MKRQHAYVILSCLLVVVMIVASVATADTGATAPGSTGACYTGSGTSTPAVTYGSGSLKYKCVIEAGDDTRCTGNTRPKCEVNCDDHCGSCFSHSAGKWVHWSSGPICVGNCKVDSSGSTCSGCEGSAQLICAVGDLYNNDECDESAGLKAWDLYGGGKPCAG